MYHVGSLSPAPVLSVNSIRHTEAQSRVHVRWYWLPIGYRCICSASETWEAQRYNAQVVNVLVSSRLLRFCTAVHSLHCIAVSTSKCMMVIPSEARFLLLMLRQDHMTSGYILCVASKRSLLLATTTPALSLSSTMFKKMVLYFLENLHWLVYLSFVWLDLYTREVNFHDI